MDIELLLANRFVIDGVHLAMDEEEFDDDTDDDEEDEGDSEDDF